jgi:uncharacterized protein YkwD
MASQSRLSHSVGGSLTKRASEAGYRYTALGENIAWNYRDANSVMRGWMKSPGHRANILGKNFTEIGVGVAHNKVGEAYHTQCFGSPAR